jgi:hypothetical protein
MPEEHLHLEQAHATLDQAGCEGVTEGVRRRPPVAVDRLADRIGRLAKAPGMGTFGFARPAPHLENFLADLGGCVIPPHGAARHAQPLKSPQARI